MENTGTTLFDDTQPGWYLGLGERYIGPLRASDIYEKIVHHEITWAHYVWKPGQAEWTRISDTPEFQAVAPAKPKSKPKPPALPEEAPVPPPFEERPWFLYHHHAQSGPFSENEILAQVKSGKLSSGQAYVWKDEMKNWGKIESTKPFSQAVAAAPQSSASAAPAGSRALRAEQRRTPRHPLIAKMFLTSSTAVDAKEGVIVAICRDISIGGMQVLTDRVPGSVGTQIRLNVSPTQDDGETQIEPFVATGVIVRILEDGRGFSFRFDKLSTAAKKAIENYIQSSG